MNCNNYIGATGPVGIGIPGQQGVTGATGPQGLKGPSQRGDTGPTGPPGPSDKTFIIEHPTDETKLLVHACLEGPEGGIYYRGVGEISAGSSAIISLPDYCRNLGYEYTVSLTAIYDGTIKSYAVSPITNNHFTVYGPCGRFQWTVMGRRCDIESELDKREEIKGQGPYTYA